MQNPVVVTSSIFSFETLRGFTPSIPWTWIGVILSVLLVEVGTRHLPGSFLKRSGGWVGELYLAEQDVLGSGVPEVVILGSSTAQYGVEPTVLEAAWGRDRGAVVNLALRGGGAFDALQVYKRNRAQLRKARAVVFCADVWTFNASFGPFQRYRLLAPLKERGSFASSIAFVRSQERAAGLEALRTRRNSLVVDHFFKMRVLTPYAIRSGTIELRLGRQKKWPQVGAGRILAKRPQSLGPERIEEARFRSLARERCEAFAIHPLYVEHLRELARLLREDGVRLIVVELPVRDRYQDLLESEFDLEVAAHTSTLASLTRATGTTWLQFRRASECGLAPEDFRDYAHLATDGTRKLSRFLGEQLLPELYPAQ